MCVLQYDTYLICFLLSGLTNFYIRLATKKNLHFKLKSIDTDRSWMHGSKATSQYINEVIDFHEFAFRHASQSREIICMFILHDCGEKETIFTST